MKKLTQLTLLLLAFLLPATAAAYDFKVDGIYYDRNFGTNTVTVTAMSFGSIDNNTFYSGDVIIPSTVTYNGYTYAVTSIGWAAFRGCRNMTSVTIPSSIKTIDSAAFFKCSGLTSITIPNSVTTIGSSAFLECTGLMSITIPNSVTSIGEEAFDDTAWYNNQPDGLVYFGSWAYKYKGTMLDGTSITINVGTHAIASGAFKNCTGLSNVTIPNSVILIDESVFSGCTGLSSVTIPNSVITISRWAFKGCTGLSSVTIPSSVKTIGNSAFSDCMNLRTLNYNAVCCADFESTYGPFYGLNISNINFGNTVQKIPAYFGESLKKLTSVTIGNYVDSIGNYAFSGCTGLTSVNLSNHVKSIGNGVFNYCTGLTSITIPNSVTSIGQLAFYNCTGLTSVHITDMESWCNISFSGSSPLYYAQHLFLNDEEVKDLVIPNTITSIKKYAFQGCIGLTSVTIPNSVKSIGERAFSLCSGLTNVTIPNSINYIGYDAFYNCSSLNEVYSYIEDPSLISMGTSVFYLSPSNYDNRILYVPVGSLATYQTDTNWSQYFGSIVEMVATVLATSIELDVTNTKITEGETVQLTVTVLPEEATDKGVAWSSDDETVATVDQNGLVVAVGAGTATITTTTTDGSNLSASCTVTVEPNVVIATSIELNQLSADVTEGETLQLTATVLPEEATDKSVAWSSSDEAVATVDQNGLVTAVGAGTATVTATTMDGSNLSASCTVTIEPTVVLATSIAMNQTSADVTEGETLQLTATVLPEDATDKSVAWSSSDETVATVDQDGLVAAVVAGTATITATTVDGSELSASCVVTVNGTDVSNTLDADALTVYCGEEKQLAVRMDNESSITALQCDIYLPEGISIATDDGDYLIDLVPARKATNHTVSTNDLPNGAIRLFITSATSKPFKGNSGDLFILNLVVDDDAESGEYSIDLRNVILSDTEAHPYYAPDLEVPISIRDYIKGDVNSDRTVNVSDYVATANYILELDPHPFLFAAADIDENQTINVSDLVGVANIALNFMGAPAVNRAPAIGYDGVGTMTLAANCSSIAPDRYAVTLDLSNSSAVTAFQMDINLPNGMKLVGATLSDRATASHSLEMTELASGAYRLLGASMMSKPFAGCEGTLLTLEIEGNANGMAIIDGIMLAEPNTALHKHDAMMLTFDASSVHELRGEVRIYTQDGLVVVESPETDKVQFILSNGMSIMREVKAGRNVYDTGLQGVVMVKVGDQVKKFKL